MSNELKNKMTESHYHYITNDGRTIYRSYTTRGTLVWVADSEPFFYFTLLDAYYKDNKHPCKLKGRPSNYSGYKVSATH